ncbi:hypothetical protein, partial [Klebsiella pneumoniae]|uniref:hypothetical protein n=1 Tax=Klebsiella pneumoniae TaxID=573 RepID=UPI003013EED2
NHINYVFIITKCILPLTIFQFALRPPCNLHDIKATNQETRKPSATLNQNKNRAGNKINQNKNRAGNKKNLAALHEAHSARLI